MSEYNDDWEATAHLKKVGVNWRCERCGHPHDIINWHILTVHHIDGNKKNDDPRNLIALCQRCHLSVQGSGRRYSVYSPLQKVFAF